MIETHSAGGIVVNGLGQVLMVHQYGDAMWFPKGHIEAWEQVIDAAYREIEEESGVSRDDLVFVKELGSYQRYRIDRAGKEDPSEIKNITLFLFKCKRNDAGEKIREGSKVAWVEPANIFQSALHPVDQAFLRKVLPEIRAL